MADPNQENIPLQTPRPGNRKEEWSDEMRLQVAQNLISISKDGIVPRDGVGEIARKLSVSQPCVSRMHMLVKKLARDPTDLTTVDMTLLTRKPGLRGKTKIHDRGFVQQELAKLSYHERRCIRSIADNLGIPKSVIHRMDLRHCTVAIKPFLSDKHMENRLVFALDHLEPHPTDPGKARFKDMMDRIHIDEKWFFIVETSTGIYVADDEEVSSHTIHHKSHIPKVMFLCAVAHPRYVATLSQEWDGKIGIWPIAEKVPAKRSSRNRPAGTLVWKNLSVNAQVYEQFLCEKLLPAIDALPAPLRNIHWKIQEDNAPAHVTVRKNGFVAQRI
jgi:hypothetical protein